MKERPCPCGYRRRRIKSKKKIITCAVGGRGDPCTQCSEDEQALRACSKKLNGKRNGVVFSAGHKCGNFVLNNYLQ